MALTGNKIVVVWLNGKRCCSDSRAIVSVLNVCVQECESARGSVWAI